MSSKKFVNTLLQLPLSEFANLLSNYVRDLPAQDRLKAAQGMSDAANRALDEDAAMPKWEVMTLSELLAHNVKIVD